MTSGPVVSVTRVMALSGTCPAAGAAEIDDLPDLPGSCWKSGLTARTTRYWFNWVKIVETCRWPKAS